MSQDISDKVFDEFRSVFYIDTYGGEMQCKPDCLDVVASNIAEMKKLARKYNINFMKNEYHSKQGIFYPSGRAKNLDGEKRYLFL